MNEKDLWALQTPCDEKDDKRTMQQWYGVKEQIATAIKEQSCFSELFVTLGRRRVYKRLYLAGKSISSVCGCHQSRNDAPLW
jgi:hypothetical protein